MKNKIKYLLLNLALASIVAVATPPQASAQFFIGDSYSWDFDTVNLDFPLTGVSVNHGFDFGYQPIDYFSFADTSYAFSFEPGLALPIQAQVDFAPPVPFDFDVQLPTTGTFEEALGDTTQASFAGFGFVNALDSNVIMSEISGPLYDTSGMNFGGLSAFDANLSAFNVLGLDRELLTRDLPANLEMSSVISGNTLSVSLFDTTVSGGFDCAVMNQQLGQFNIGPDCGVQFNDPEPQPQDSSFGSYIWNLSNRLMNYGPQNIYKAYRLDPIGTIFSQWESLQPSMGTAATGFKGAMILLGAGANSKVYKLDDGATVMKEITTEGFGAEVAALMAKYHNAIAEKIPAVPPYFKVEGNHLYQKFGEGVESKNLPVAVLNVAREEAKLMYKIGLDVLSEVHGTRIVSGYQSIQLPNGFHMRLDPSYNNFLFNGNSGRVMTWFDPVYIGAPKVP